MEAKDFIGLDVGRARTGFARGSMLARLAEALFTKPTFEALDELKRLTSAGVSGVVVGLPRSLAGEETEQTRWVRDWLDEAKKEVAITFYWQDEALSTKLAEAKTLSKSKVVDIDALAAAIILQDFLDSPEDMRVVA